MHLNDYLDSLSVEERDAFSDGPHAQIAARHARPFTDLGSNLVYYPTATPAPSLTTRAPSMIYAGPSAPSPRVVAPTSTPPVDAGTWRSMVSMAALQLATAIANVIRLYPSSPVTTALFVTPLRSFGLTVLDPSRMSVDNARATINGLASLLRGASFVSAGGAAELRAGLDRVIAMIPASSSPTWTPTPSIPGGGGGIGPSTPGPSTTVPGGGGGGSPPPSTTGCPTNATYNAAAGGCACDAGFVPNATLDACVPVSSSGSSSCPVGYRPNSSGGCDPNVPGRTYGGGLVSSWGGWLLLLGGGALLYKAAAK
jgi:hypothetical protein